MTLGSTFAQFPRLLTPRLLLRQLDASDADDFFAILSDEEVTRYYGRPPHRAIDETHALIQRLSDIFARREGLRWAVVLRDTDRLIGTCCLYHFDDDYRHAELGYELAHAYWGRGLMSEAIAAVLTYGFIEMDLQQIEADVDIANERSKAVLHKFGFNYAGDLHEDDFTGERYLLSRRKWQQSHQSPASTPSGT